MVGGIRLELPQIKLKQHAMITRLDEVLEKAQKTDLCTSANVEYECSQEHINLSL